MLNTKFKAQLECLAFEVTRKCDLNCEFCAKGRAQEMTMTKEIIDKTLDEVQDMYIDVLRISGGEPFLVPDMIQYLFDKIIEKHIYINQLCIFTNGNHKEKSLIGGFEKMADYLEAIENECKNIIMWNNYNHGVRYKSAEKSKIAIIISTHFHQTSKQDLLLTKRFYQKVNRSNFKIILQDEDFEKIPSIILEGNALEIFKNLIPNPTKQEFVRILDNNYCFVKYSNNNNHQSYLKDMVFITKSLSVSANGNVHVGCTMSYKNIDKSPMFNILNCNNDFLEKVDNWCWKTPINKNAKRFKEKYKTYMFLKNNNIKVIGDNDFAEQYDLYKAITDFYEKTAKDMHQILPKLNHEEIEAVSIAITILHAFDAPVSKSKMYGVISSWLEFCTEISIDDFGDLTPEWCRGFIAHWAEIDKERQAIKT